VKHTIDFLVSLQIISSSRILATTLFGLVKDVGQVAATAVLAVVHGGHEDAGTALNEY